MTTRSTIDFAAHWSDNARLHAKVTELCPDCRNDPEWRRDGAHGDLVPCTHPNAPTIGQMLREWQALTALAEYATHHDWNCPRPSRADCACGLDAARAALEAVRGD